MYPVFNDLKNALAQSPIGVASCYQRNKFFNEGEYWTRYFATHDRAWVVETDGSLREVAMTDEDLPQEWYAFDPEREPASYGLFQKVRPVSGFLAAYKDACDLKNQIISFACSISESDLEDDIVETLDHLVDACTKLRSILQS